MARALVDDLVAASADPAGVARTLERLGAGVELIEHGSDLAAAVVAVAAASDSLRELLVHDDEALGALADLDRPLAVVATSAHELHRTRHLAFLGIVARDLLGLRTLDQTTADLSALATSVFRGVAELADADGLVIVAMGKLGARELNVVSDVDVMFVGAGDPDELERAARRVIAVVGQSYTVDTTLRPEGRDGQLVRTIDGFASYWRRWARPWEFQALLKARPIAGPSDLQAEFATAAADALWSAELGADALRELRHLKARAEASVERRGMADRDVKLGRGGLRDIEFSVQLLQLVHGRADPLLRIPATRAGLRQLRSGDYVDAEEAETLDQAYVFLRCVEHAVQLVHERQTHRVPEEREARRRLARVLGYRGASEAGPTERFDDDLAMHRLAVRRVHEGWYFRPLLDAFAGGGAIARSASDTRLEAFGFSDAQRTRQAVGELTRGLTRSSRLMRQLLPLVFDWLSQSPDPDLGLLALRRLVTGPQRATAITTTFRDSTEVARNLSLLLGTAPLVGELFESNPDLIERLDDPDRLATLDRPSLVDSAERASPWREPDEQAPALRRWMRRHLTGIVARDILGDLDHEGVGRDLTGIAEAVLEVAIRWERPQVPVAVIGMGRLGGHSLAYVSDIDLVFVYAGEGPDDFAEAERVATGVLRTVGGRTPAGRIFAVDPDLRPEGSTGPLARSLDSYDAYLDRWAETWERQALLRARFVAGAPAVGARFAELVERHVWQRRPTDDDVRAIRRLKARMERERIPASVEPRFHMKLGPGSLSDIEFTVQLLQWRHGRRGSSTTRALGDLEQHDHIDPESAAVLRAAHRACDVLRNRLWLVAGVADVLPTGRDHLRGLARSLGITTDELIEDYLRRTRRSRGVVERLFYGER